MTLCIVERRTSSNTIQFRLRNDLYCVGWSVKLYSLTHSFPIQTFTHFIFILFYILLYFIVY